MKKNAAKDIKNDPSAFRRQVRVSALQVTGLTPDELSTALAYEVEAASGIPAAEAQVSWTAVVDPDPEFRLYDVIVRRKVEGSSGGKAEKIVRFFIFVSIALVLGIAVDFSLMFFKSRSIDKEILVRAPLDAEVRSIEYAAKVKREEAERKRAERQAKAAAQERVAEVRAAYSQLLGALASACGGKVVVKEISSIGPFAAEMRAVAASAQDGSEALSALTRAAKAVGWRAAPGDIITSENSIVEFSCKFIFSAVKLPSRNGR